MKNASKTSKQLASKCLHASIHAANAVKKRGGNSRQQDSAAISASLMIQQGKTGATAVENGYRVGMGMAAVA